ncbi:transposase [Streptomyces sp. NPDC002133]|uniref:transposase n=1 Tax=Streptomyces sp. NPDC002133 TaxID=3154409 RepID=UPI0033176D37
MWIFFVDDHVLWDVGIWRMAQWARLERLLPECIEPGRPHVSTRRQLMDGIRRRTRTGAPWRDVPERYGAVGGSMT